MSKTPVEKFTKYLSAFSAHSAASKNMFDEYVQSSEFDDSLKIDTFAERAVIKLIEDPNFKGSVLLSGNAGDGKSRLCRSLQQKFMRQKDLDFDLSDGRRIHIIPDISEFNEIATRDILTSAFESDVIYLICANEGKVFSVLRQWGKDDERRKMIETQMLDGPNHQKPMVVFNLNLFPTSVYIKPLLSKMVEHEAWESCLSCEARDACPIYFNRDKLGDNLIQERILLLHEVMEGMGNHTTMREMISHLVYVLLGGLTCEDIKQEYNKINRLFSIHAVEEMQKKMKMTAYFCNLWGDSLPKDIINRNSAFRNLQLLDIKNQSIFFVDNYIIQGDVTEDKKLRESYSTLFAPAIDLGGREFHYRRAYYLNTGGNFVEENDQYNKEFLDNWLGLMRRKLFLEWWDAPVSRMLPLLSFNEYQGLLKEREDTKLKGIILSLNRVFTGLFINQENFLYLTSHFYGGTERQLPIVEFDIPYNNLQLYVQKKDVMGYTMKRLVFTYGLPGMISDATPKLDLNLLLYEYLYRIRLGGSRKDLAHSCELKVIKFKEEMMAFLNKFMSTQVSLDELKIIFRDQIGEYSLRTIKVESDKERIKIV